MLSKTVKKKKKDKYKIQADGYLCEGEGRKEDKGLKGIDNLLLTLGIH